MHTSRIDWMRPAAALFLAAALLGPAALTADTKPAPVSFTRQVLPFFKDRCITCHGSDQPMKNLALDSAEGVKRGGDQGPVFVAGKSADSLLVQYLTGSRTPKMPPNEELDDSYVKLIRRWIDEGAKFDAPAKK